MRITARAVPGQRLLGGAVTQVGGIRADLTTFRPGPAERAQLQATLIEAAESPSPWGFMLEAAHRLVPVMKNVFPELREIPSEYLAAVHMHSGSGYRPANRWLETGRPEPSSQPEPQEVLEARILATAAALVELRELPGNRVPVLHHGGSLPDSQAKAIQVGDILAADSFLSAAAKHSTASTFRENAVTRRGATTALLATIEHHGGAIPLRRVATFPGEGEHLFPPGTRFLVKAKTLDEASPADRPIKARTHGPWPESTQSLTLSLEQIPFGPDSADIVQW